MEQRKQSLVENFKNKIKYSGYMDLQLQYLKEMPLLQIKNKQP